MTDMEKYELSLYETVRVINRSSDGVIEEVKNSLDGNKYIKKSYPSDKREVYGKISQIDAKNIAGVKAVFFDTDTIVIEEYVEGRLLSEVLSTDEAINLSRIIEDIISAVGELHKAGVVHRDIKPSNIMVDKDGRAVLIDYGIARIYDEKKEKDTELYGTLGYASPEQYGYSQSDYRSDIFSLGKTIQAIAKHRKVEKKYLDIAAKCTSFDPDKRFQSITEIQSKLKTGVRLRAALLIVLPLVIMAAFYVIISNRNTWLAGGRTDIAGETGIGMVETYEDELNNEKAPGGEEESGYGDNPEAGIESESVHEKESDADEIKTETERDYDDTWNYEDSYAGDFVTITETTGKVECVRIDRGSNSADVIINNKTIALDIEFDDALTIAIDDGEPIRLEYNPDYESQSYDDTELMCELLLYDMNGDDAYEIIPMICDGKKAQGSLLRNGTIGWCIYEDGNGEYVLAEDKFEVHFDPIILSGGIIRGDNLTSYQLADGKIVER